MRKNIVIMSPTVNRAVYEWKAFLSRWSTIIKKANRRSLCIELLSGQKIFFKGETEGQRALRGLRTDIISADEFVMPQVEERTCFHLREAAEKAAEAIQNLTKAGISQENIESIDRPFYDPDTRRIRFSKPENNQKLKEYEGEWVAESEVSDADSN